MSAQDDEEDLFAMFGGDEDEDEGESSTHEDTNVNAQRARELLAKANQQTHSARDSKNTAAGSGSSSISAFDTLGDVPVALGTLAISDMSAMSPLKLPWDKPLYTGSIQLVASLPVGGGRGYVATQTLPPGTLVLVEQPILAWPEGDASSVDLERIKVIIMTKEASKVVAAMEHLHPTRSLVNETVGCGMASDNPCQVEEMIQHYREAIQSDNLSLKTILQVAAAKEVKNSDSSALTELDVLRLLVALRYNSLETGIYLHVAMLNHADFSNCVKFRSTKQGGYSEVRTTRTVQAGQALTISYVPRLVCHASRRKLLWHQHRFESGNLQVSSTTAVWELINNNLPICADVELMQNVETATAELEDQCRDLAALATNQTLADDEAETAKALELSALELYTSASDQLKNENHCLLIPCLTLHLDACDLVQRNVQLPKPQRALLLTRLVTTGRRLTVLQKRILGPHHFNLARTNLDVAQGIQELLSEAPKDLFASDEAVAPTVHFWSTAENNARKEHDRIKNMYPHDAEKYLPLPP